MLLLAAPIGGCGGDEAEARTFSDIGTFCLESSGDGRLTFTVSVSAASRCLSACRINELSCRATLTGDRVDLTTRLEIRDDPDNPDNRVCDAACHGTSGSCELEAVPPGEYDFGFASRFDTAELPLASPIALFGDHGCAAAD